MYYYVNSLNVFLLTYDYENNQDIDILNDWIFWSGFKPNEDEVLELYQLIQGFKQMSISSHLVAAETDHLIPDYHDYDIREKKEEGLLC